MATPEEELETLISGNEKQYADGREQLGMPITHDDDDDLDPEPDPDPDLELDPEPEPDPEPDPKDPPGYMSYEDWVAEGKDPELFKGKKAYEKEYGRIQDSKKVSKELGEMRETLRVTTETIGEWKQDQHALMEAELEKRLDDAKRSDDLDGALDAQDKLTKHQDKKPDAAPEPIAEQETNPLVDNFLEATPIFNKESKQFDRKAMSQMERIYNGKLQMLDDGSHQFSQDDIQDCLDAAYREVEGLNPHLKASPRNQRRGANNKRPTRQQGKPAPGQKNMKIERKNPRDNNAYGDVYQMLLKKDPEAAKQFAKNMEGAD